MFPIILAHGIARFDFLKIKLAHELEIDPNSIDDRLQYFKGIRSFLNAHGFSQVRGTNVEFAGSVQVRADNLKAEINAYLAETGAEKVHIIAHSMGGLDARWMIAELGMGEKVASLTTIGTPHHGTVLADRVLGIGGVYLLDVIEKVFNLDLDGFHDLTTAACAEFNDKLRDAEAENGVFYQTYSSFEKLNRMFLPLVVSWLIIRTFEETNDGLVPLSSQRWTDKLTASDGTSKDVVQKDFPMPADHLNEIGWWDTQEAVNPLTGGSLIEQKKEFEAKIREVYLGIANDLQSRFG